MADETTEEAATEGTNPYAKGAHDALKENRAQTAQVQAQLAVAWELRQIGRALEPLADFARIALAEARDV